MVEKVEFLEAIILKLSQDSLEEANDLFACAYQYDLRKTDNGDHLVFNGWEIEDDILVLNYHEITPHDCPYGIEVRYNIKDLSIINKANEIYNGNTDTTLQS